MRPSQTPRTDLEVLRVLTLILVLAGLVGWLRPATASAGYDLAFVLAGYLSFQSLSRTFNFDGRVWLVDSWTSVLRRRLPALSVVLTISALALWLLTGPMELAVLRFDLIRAAFGLTFLEGTSAEALGNPLTSPFAHLWSVGLAQAVLLVLPVIWFLADLVSRRRFTVLIATALTAVLTHLSFRYYLDSDNGDFTSFAHRGWEFGVGALAAALPTIAANRYRTWLLWAGRIALVATVAFAGGWSDLRLTTLLVVLCAIVLWIGEGERGEPGAIGTLGLIFGRISYSTYLYAGAFLWFANRLQGSGFGTVIALLAAFLAGAATTGFVEKNYRKEKREASTTTWRSFRTTLQSAFTAVAAAGMTTLLPAMSLDALPETTPTISASPRATNSTAAVTDQEWLDQLIADTLPSFGVDADLPFSDLADASSDFPTLTNNGCHVELFDQEPSRRCVLGDENAKFTVMLFGDSHALGMSEGLLRATERLGIRLLPRTRSACPTADVLTYSSKLGAIYEPCAQFRESVLTEISEIKPDLVVLLNQRPLFIVDENQNVIEDEATSFASWQEGLSRTINRITDAGSKPLVIRDLPRWTEKLPDCLVANGVSGCERPTQDALQPTSADIDLVDPNKGQLALDFSSAFCDDTTCHPLLADRVVASDEVHLTRHVSMALTKIWVALLQRHLGIEQ